MLEEATESPAAEALTIGWMLTVMTTLACELGLIAADFYRSAHPDSEPVRALCTLLLLASAMIGLVSLCLFPLVLKIRRQTPPLGIKVFAVVIAVAPLALLTATLLAKW